MRIPSFAKTIRFKLTLLYLALFLLFSVVQVGGINLAMQHFRDTNPVITQGAPEMVASGEILRLRIYSLIAIGLVPLLGFAGGYFLVGRMLKPVSRVSALASQISSTNLKERINYRGSDDEIKRLADTFDEMLSRLEVSFESQKQFIQDASHELRTPIAIAQTSIEVTEMAKKVTASDYQSLMSVLKRSLERMTQLSDQLQILADVSQERANWQVVDVKSIVNEVAAEVGAKMTLAGIDLELCPTSDEALVRGDSLRLKQAVLNLVDNAIKYNRPGGKLKILTRVEQSRLVVEIQDNGIGISSADQPHVFERFYRVDKSRNRSLGGSGLGLAIVKKIVEDHGGAISVESALGSGSTFRLWIPRCQAT